MTWMQPLFDALTLMLGFMLSLLVQTTLALGIGLMVYRQLGRRDFALRKSLAATMLLAVLLLVPFSLFSYSQSVALCNIPLPTVLPQEVVLPHDLPTEVADATTNPESEAFAATRTEPEQAEARVSEAAPSEEAGFTTQAPIALSPEQATTLMSSREAVIPTTLLIASFLLPMVWLLGVAWNLMRVGLGLLKLQHIRRRCTPITNEHTLSDFLAVCSPMPLKIRPLLLESQAVQIPFVVGGSRPAVILPKGFAETLSSGTLRAVFAHELAHLQNGDPTWRMMFRLTCSLLWFQPLLWMLHRFWSKDSEAVADQSALRQPCTRQEYAYCLLNLATRLPFGNVPTGGIGMTHKPSNLHQRIEHIARLDSVSRFSKPTRYALKVFVFGAVLFSCIGVAVKSISAEPTYQTAQSVSTIAPFDKYSGTILPPTEPQSISPNAEAAYVQETQAPVAPPVPTAPSEQPEPSQSAKPETAPVKQERKRKKQLLEIEQKLEQLKKENEELRSAIAAQTFAINANANQERKLKEEQLKQERLRGYDNHGIASIEKIEYIEARNQLLEARNTINRISDIYSDKSPYVQEAQEKYKDALKRFTSAKKNYDASLQRAETTQRMRLVEAARQRQYPSRAGSGKRQIDSSKQQVDILSKLKQANDNQNVSITTLRKEITRLRAELEKERRRANKQ